MTPIVVIALGIVLGFLMLRNLDAILALGVTAVIGAFWLALLAIVGVGFYWGWELIASHEKILVGVTFFSFLVLGLIVAGWIGKRTGLEPIDILIFGFMLFMLVSATAIFSALIYQWSSDAADLMLYLFIVPIVGLWAWLIVKAKRHIRERRKPVATVGIPDTSPIGGSQ